MRASSVDMIILDTLTQVSDHLTSLQIYEVIRQRLPAVNPSTVYRALERLAKSGKVSISDLGTGAVVYEVVSEGMHHHLVCQKCGKMTTIGHDEVIGFFAALEQKNQFKVATKHLVLFGLCRECC